MSILAWLVLGLIAGFIASKIVNKTGEGVVLDIVLGWSAHSSAEYCLPSLVPPGHRVEHLQHLRRGDRIDRGAVSLPRHRRPRHY